MRARKGVVVLLQCVLTLDLRNGRLTDLTQSHVAICVIKPMGSRRGNRLYGSFFTTTIPSPPPVTFSWALMTIASWATWKSATVIGKGIRNSRIIECSNKQCECVYGMKNQLTGIPAVTLYRNKQRSDSFLEEQER